MLEGIDWTKVSITNAKIGRLFEPDEQALKTPNDIEREASTMSEKETLSIGEKMILTEIQKLNDNLCDVKVRLDNKYVTFDAVYQIEKKLDSLFNKSEEELSVSMDGKEVGKLLDTGDFNSFKGKV